MSSFVGRIIRLGIFEKFADSFPESFIVFRHLSRVGLSSYLLTYKLPLLFPMAMLLTLILVRKPYTSVTIQVLFLSTLLGSPLIAPQERLKRFSPILRELFHYKNPDLQCRVAVFHLGLAILLYFLNWLMLAYYAIMMVFM